MPSLSVHLLVGLVLLSLCYLNTRDFLSSILCLLCSIIPDVDSIFGIHRSFITHNFLIPIIMFLFSIFFKIMSRFRLSRVFLWSSIGYFSHLIFDIFTGYVALMYPIFNICISSRLIVQYFGRFKVSIFSNLSILPCSLVPRHVIYMSDKIMIIVFIFTLIVLILVLKSHVK